MSDQAYWMRIEVHRRMLGALKTQGEETAIWIAPTPGTGRYSARPVALNAGEEIRQGVNQSQDFMKLELKGDNLPIDAVDRVKIVTTGRIYRITAEPIKGRDRGGKPTTTISIELLPGVS